MAVQSIPGAAPFNQALAIKALLVALLECSTGGWRGPDQAIGPRSYREFVERSVPPPCCQLPRRVRVVLEMETNGRG